MLKQVVWHLGVVLAVAALVLAVLARNWALTLVAVALAWGLKRTSRYIPLPRIYQEMGLTEEYLMGTSRPSEKTASN